MLGALATFAFLSASPLMADATLQSADGSDIADAVGLTVTTDRSVVGIGEPVVLQLAITNRLSEILQFDLGGNYVGNIRIRLTGPYGQSSQVLSLTRNGIAELGIIALPAGQRFSHQVVLDEWVTLSQGSYTAEVAVQSLFVARSGAVLTPPPPRVVHFDVGPRQEARLHQLCEEMAAAAMGVSLGLGAPGGELTDQMKAIRILARIVDPVAVPCVEKVLLATDVYDVVLIPALARINTAEAQAILLHLSTSADERRARHAQGMINGLSAGRVPAD